MMGDMMMNSASNIIEKITPETLALFERAVIHDAYINLGTSIAEFLFWAFICGISFYMLRNAKKATNKLSGDDDENLEEKGVAVIAGCVLVVLFVMSLAISLTHLAQVSGNLYTIYNPTGATIQKLLDAN